MQQIETVVVQKQERLLPGIHGLRGTAALAVVLYHLVHVGSMKPPDVFGFIGRDFGYSVHLFFVLSAFSLMYSTQPTLGRPNWLAAYLTKRFFRIAPLFYCMVVFEAGRQWVMGGAAPPLTTLLLNSGRCHCAGRLRGQLSPGGSARHPARPATDRAQHGMRP